MPEIMKIVSDYLDQEIEHHFKFWKQFKHFVEVLHRVNKRDGNVRNVSAMFFGFATRLVIEQMAV